MQPGEQIQQNGNHTTPESQQPGVPYSQRPGEQIQQNGNRTTPESHSLNRSQKFRVPAGPLPQEVPTTPMPTIPTTPMSAMPATPRPYAQAAIIDPRIQERVKYYADWLAKQARYDELNDNAKEINDYIQEATKVVQVGKQKVPMLRPFRPKLSALQTFTTRQVVALCIIGLLWLIGLLVFRLQMLMVVVAAVTVIYFFNLMLNVSMALRTFRNSPEERVSDEIVHALKDADWPLYTILCPLYREAQVVPQFAQAMLALDYPAEKLQILFLTEADDAETRKAIRALSLPPHFKVLVVPDGKPRTKPRACNYGLMHAKGPYVVIYDAEDIPSPLP